MSPAHKHVTLENLSEFARLMPKGLPQEQVIAALGELSLECSLNYQLSKTFLADGWIVEYRHLRAAARLSTINDLLLFATAGGLRVIKADGTQQMMKSGDQLLLVADTQVTVWPEGEDGNASLIALSVELDLGQVLEDVGDKRVW
ncbi:hypothetical protein I5O09_17600 [Pseudomonas parafulva]|uniref:hypothetical protein n=1 Tax=Pseudomonas parafulva TaxID=157782 RepID=UPI0018D6289D|nr:hypothetical protein [Pseudomonas parafulva]MBH3345559.1 hypothetical protein [Pseudomonas parafulva]